MRLLPWNNNNSRSNRRRTKVSDDEGEDDDLRGSGSGGASSSSSSEHREEDGGDGDGDNDSLSTSSSSSWDAGSSGSSGSGSDSSQSSSSASSSSCSSSCRSSRSGSSSGGGSSSSHSADNDNGTASIPYAVDVVVDVVSTGTGTTPVAAREEGAPPPGFLSSLRRRVVVPGPRRNSGVGIGSSSSPNELAVSTAAPAAAKSAMTTLLADGEGGGDNDSSSKTKSKRRHNRNNPSNNFLDAGHAATVQSPPRYYRRCSRLSHLVLDARRRLIGAVHGNCTEPSGCTGSNRRHHRHRSRRNSSRAYEGGGGGGRADDVCSAIATVLFCTSLAVFAFVTVAGIFGGNGGNGRGDYYDLEARIASSTATATTGSRKQRRGSTATKLISMDRLTVRQRTKLRTQEKHMNRRSDLFAPASAGGAGSGAHAGLGEIKVQRRKRDNNPGEALPPDCVQPEWQQRRPLSCNDVHAMTSNLAAAWEQDEATTATTGGARYLSDGLWRTVWAVPDNSPSSAANADDGSSNNKDNNVLVMKMMKSEHDVDSRNLDRHRRDALVMERLSASPNVVDIYGYCGNTVMTEYIETPLDSIVHTSTSANKNAYKLGLPTGRRAPRSEDGTASTLPTRETPEGRLHLALEVARGLEALHADRDGPIVHADLQAKQFLVAPNGKVKINDFNRCRFVARRNSTNTASTTADRSKRGSGEFCPFRIPTSPGKWRSPEEYSSQDLSEKMDVFSLGNVLHAILTGEDPWDGWSTVEVRKTVKGGMRPIARSFDEKVGGVGGASPIDKALQELTLRAYELDPEKRIGASELVRELEELRSRTQQQRQ